ncbi:sugar ABC transporter substrate-binding protein [Arthrobacter frigidicola]|nr:sugar ABC transporter substrate-binding protein [Arthrobacter frigidicola]
MDPMRGVSLKSDENHLAVRRVADRRPHHTSGRFGHRAIRQSPAGADRAARTPGTAPSFNDEDMENLMKKHVPLTVASFAAAAAMSLSGCSGGAEGAGGGSPTLGLVQFSGDDVFSNSALEGAAELAESQGWETITVDAKGSVDGANSAMTNLVTKGVDALIVSVFPSTALGSGIAAAQEAGVPVANWGGGQAEGVKFSSDTGLGDALAEKLVADMGGKGELLALTYPPGLPCQSREASLDQAVEGTDVTVTKQQITIPGAVSSASDATVAWAAAHPQSSTPLAVWACYDDPATGVAAGLKLVDRTDVMSYGLNGTKEAVGLVQSGDLTATLWINGPKQGEDLFTLLQEDLDNGQSSEPQEIGGETEVVDATTVAEFLELHPELR